MSYSLVKYTGDGTTTSFPVPFSYMQQNHVKVTVNKHEVGHTWSSEGVVSITPAPAVNTQILIERITPIDSKVVDFADGSVLTEDDLDTSADQVFYAVQEIDDEVKDGLSEFDKRLTAGFQANQEHLTKELETAKQQINSDLASGLDSALKADANDKWDFKGRQSINVPEGIEDTDIANVRQMKAAVHEVQNIQIDVNSKASTMTAQLAAAGQAVTDTQNAVTEATAQANQSRQSARASEASAANAGDKETMAEKWAINPENTPVEANKFSAYHWAMQSRKHADSVATGVQVMGGLDASTGQLPATPNDPRIAEIYFVSTAGTLPEIGAVSVGGQVIWSVSLHKWFYVGSAAGVTSVNGQTGDVSLTASDVHALSTDTIRTQTLKGSLQVQNNGQSPTLSLEADNNGAAIRNTEAADSGYRSIGINNAGEVVAYSVDNGFKHVYHEGHKPTAADIGAVSSVNGQTGAVTIDGGVTSVNGHKGAVTLTASDIHALGVSQGTNTTVTDVKLGAGKALKDEANHNIINRSGGTTYIGDSSSTIRFDIANADALRANIKGGNNNAKVYNEVNLPAIRTRAIYVSSSNPSASDGEDGDIWVKYEN